jgi:DNA-binding NtrC family response regulator
MPAQRDLSVADSIWLAPHDLAGSEGLDLLSEIVAHDSTLPVIVMTASCP